MSKILVLCRHGKAENPSNSDDFVRPLKEKGKIVTEIMGELLSHMDIQTDIIISSPAKRAISTAEILAKQLNFTNQIQLEQDIYEQDLEKEIELIRNINNDNISAIVVGHNPTMEKLARTFLSMEGLIEMPTCGIVAIEFSSDDWKSIQEHLATLKWFLSPKMVLR
ncbi:histidine phosphatase family protein [Bacteroidales bacterium AH-315-N07]|nr:histidine phosphatase family protein [Bacteroidales bacterium AH-315-N07]